MKVLIVASYNKGKFAPFIVEQANALKDSGLQVDFFGIKGKGIVGYFSNLSLLKQKIKEFNPDIIHAHYGLSGLFACLQRTIPVVTTYHGSDINVKKALRFSKLAMRFSAWNIFVSQKNVNISDIKIRFSLIPCGINLSDYISIEKTTARKEMNLDIDHKYVLFAGAFDNRVKNAMLAQESMTYLPHVSLLELKGYTRQQVVKLFYAVDAFLMTSFTEGSPQVIKEALATGCPIVSVDVGDVKEITENLEGCYVTNRNPQNIADNLLQAMNCSRTKGYQRIVDKGLDNKQVVKKLIAIYKSILRNK